MPAHSDAVAAVPYVDRLYESLSYVVMRAASYLSRRPFKVVCVDCDNTLWRGVVGEVNDLGSESAHYPQPYPWPWPWP